MHNQTKKTTSRLLSMLVAAVMILAAFSLTSLTALAAGYDDLEDGKTYVADADLSCWVSAMGGVQFGGGGIFDGQVTINVDGSGNKSFTMNFATGGFTIYGVAAVTFLDANPENPDTSRGVTPGTIGIYAQDGSTIITDGVSYTESSNTAVNPFENPVPYINSITFPLPYDANAYNLTFYLNSQVMGMQFCNPNAQATGTPYPAVLTIDWDSLEEVKTADETANQSANVIYEVTGGYEVKIPATINVNSTTKVGEYTVEAENFVLPAGAYVTVTADTAGSVANGGKTIPFTNTLESGKLLITGDTLDGTVIVTETGNGTIPGTYTGTLEFTINYYAE
ncbi:MAG: hypothetical protein LBJ12_06475 [Oscillospiraceae bacterium]|jgi:hypothetical protein|nr:hypothetical protein [Oscillospiraceae bacterium]